MKFLIDLHIRLEENYHSMEEGVIDEMLIKEKILKVLGGQNIVPVEMLSSIASAEYKKPIFREVEDASGEQNNSGFPE